MKKHRRKIERNPSTTQDERVKYLNTLLDAPDKIETVRCTMCPLWETSITAFVDDLDPETTQIVRRSCVPGRGSLDAPILLVGEAPGDHEVVEDSAFVGPSGLFLNRALNSIGITSKCRVTNTFRCKPPFLQVPNRIIYSPCLSNLRREIREVQPRAIGCLGATAFHEVCRMLGVRREKLVLSEEVGNVIYPIVKEEVSQEVTVRGKQVVKTKLVNKKGTPIVPLFHPSAYLRSIGNDASNPLNWMDPLSFTNGLRVVAKEAGVDVENHLPKYRILTKYADVVELLENLSVHGMIAFDTETSPPDTSLRRKYPIPWVDKVLCVSLAWDDGEAVTIPWRKQIQKEGDPLEFYWPRKQQDHIRNLLKSILEDPKIIKCAHNGIAFDRPVLRYDESLKISVKGLKYDGMLLHHQWDQERSHGLKSLCYHYTPLGNYEAALDRAKAELPKGSSYALLPENLLYRYAAADADGEYRIIQYLLKKVRAFDERFPSRHRSPGMEKFYHSHVIKVAQLASSMEEVGAPVSTARVEELRKAYEAEIEQKRQALVATEEVQTMLRLYDEEDLAKISEKAIAMYRKLKKPRVPEDQYVADRVAKYHRATVFNPGSSKQMPRLLFEICGLPILRRTSKGKPETGKKAMDLYEHPITAKLKEIRQIAAYHRWLKQQILDNLLYSKDGRLHTSYLIIGTDTGRWSSQHPNLQNIPARGKRAKEIASIFEAPPGYAFIKADFGQAEFRLLAVYSQDPVMIEDINEGLDIHTYMASQAYGVTIEEVLADKAAGGSMREKAKNGVFLTIYGGQPARLAYELRISLEVAQRLQDAFWGRYLRAKDWVEEIRSFARSEGFTRSLLGRVNTFPGLKNSYGQNRAKLERKASNSIIQGTASDLTCLKGVLLRKAFRETGIDAHVCLQIHDALVSIVPLENWRDTFALHRKVMETPHDRITDVPMPIDQEIGFNLGQLYKESDFAKVIEEKLTRTCC